MNSVNSEQQQFLTQGVVERRPWNVPIRLIPLGLCGGFFLFTVFLHAFGPIDWHPSNPGILYAFLITCGVSLSGSYLYAVCRRKKQVSKKRRFTLSPSLVIYISSLFTVLLFVPTTLATTGSWLPDFVLAVQDPGLAYERGLEFSSTGSMAIMYLRIFLSPLTITALPVTILLYSKLSNLAKILGIAVIFLNLMQSFVLGRNKGIAEIFAFIIFVMLLKTIPALIQRNWKVLTRLLALITLIASLGFIYFGFTQNSRADRQISIAGSTTAVSSTVTTGNQVANTALANKASPRDSLLTDLTPPSILPAATMFTSYVTQGYVGLSYALESEWTPTYGVIFSDFVHRNVNKVFLNKFDVSVFSDDSYTAKVIAKGWSVGPQWGSFFIYPASDISFLGVILLMALIGFCWGLAWKDTILVSDPLAATVFFNLSILVLYLSANNQVFQAGESAVGFSVVLVSWLIIRSLALPLQNKETAE